jgi:hypothetical protein
MCVCLIGYICLKKEFLLRIAEKVLLCALAISLVIPASVTISDLIYETQQTSIENTIDEMDSFEVSEDTDEDESIIDKLTGLVTNAVDSTVDDATSMVTDLIESLAVMLAISCLIPILVFVLIIWMLKMIFSTPSIHL